MYHRRHNIEQRLERYGSSQDEKKSFAGFGVQMTTVIFCAFMQNGEKLKRFNFRRRRFGFQLRFLDFPHPVVQL